MTSEEQQTLIKAARLIVEWFEAEIPDQAREHLVIREHANGDRFANYDHAESREVMGYEIGAISSRLVRQGEVLQRIQKRLTELELKLNEVIDQANNPDFDWTKPFYTVREVADFLDVGPQFIRKKVRQGVLVARLHKGTNKYHITPESFRAYYEDRVRDRIEYQSELTLRGRNE